MPNFIPKKRDDAKLAARDALASSSTGWLVSFTDDGTEKYVGFPANHFLPAYHYYENDAYHVDKDCRIESIEGDDGFLAAYEDRPIKRYHSTPIEDETLQVFGEIEIAKCYARARMPVEHVAEDVANRLHFGRMDNVFVLEDGTDAHVGTRTHHISDMLHELAIVKQTTVETLVNDITATRYTLDKKDAIRREALTLTVEHTLKIDGDSPDDPFTKRTAI